MGKNLSKVKRPKHSNPKKHYKPWYNKINANFPHNSTVFGSRAPSKLSNSKFEIEAIDPESDFIFLNNVENCVERLRKFLEDIKDDNIVIDLRSPMGSWLADRNIGQNMYDQEGGVYLWKFPRYVLQAMLMYIDNGGYAGISMNEYVLAVYNGQA